MHASRLFDVAGRVVLITGGSAGLGRQMAQGFAELGANLAICARRRARCEQAANELQNLGGKAIGLECDVRDPASVSETAEAVVSNFGRIDVLVNNAGASWAAPVEQMQLEHWNKVLETNLTGTFLFAQAVGKIMIPQKRGKIINVASVAALGGSPPELQAIGYHASKGAVVSFTKDLACKWAPYNIQVNALAPGWFPTHMSSVVIERHAHILLSRIPAGRFGGEHDLKGAAIFLASDASDYVTGHLLVVDGGQSSW